MKMAAILKTPFEIRLSKTFEIHMFGIWAPTGSYFQLSDLMVVTLDGVEEVVLDKVLEYLYLGQTTIKKAMQNDVKDLVRSHFYV